MFSKFWKNLKRKIYYKIYKIKFIHLSNQSSHYLVSLDRYRDVVTIGCKNYSASKMLATGKAFLLEDQNSHSIFQKEQEFLKHGKFGITVEDARVLFKFLKDNGVK